MQIPSNMILTKVRPSLYMPFWVCVWSCISAATAGTTSFGGLVAVRFCLGIAEAPFFPGITPHPTVLDRLHLRARLQTGNTDHFSYRHPFYMLSCWYNQKELALRTAILYSGLVLATAFSGLLAAGIFAGLDGARYVLRTLVLGDSWDHLY
jgi:hypothetical protein